MKNADKHIAKPVAQSCLVMPKGTTKGIMTGAVAASAGSATKAAGDTLADHRGRSSSPLTGGTGSVGLLALTDDEIVLLDGRRGLVGVVATGLAGTASRSELADAEFGSGRLSSPLRLSWADGSTWEVEVPRKEIKKARALVDDALASGVAR